MRSPPAAPVAKSDQQPVLRFTLKLPALASLRVGLIAVHSRPSRRPHGSQRLSTFPNSLVRVLPVAQMAKRRIAFRRIADAALGRAETIVGRWLPSGRRAGRQWPDIDPT